MNPVWHLYSALCYGALIVLAIFDLKVAFIVLVIFEIINCVSRFIVAVLTPLNEAAKKVLSR